MIQLFFFVGEQNVWTVIANNLKTVYLSLSFSFSFYISLSNWLGLSVSQFACRFVCLSLSVCLCLGLSVSVSLWVFFFYMSVSISVIRIPVLSTLTSPTLDELKHFLNRESITHSPKHEYECPHKRLQMAESTRMWIVFFFF